VVRWCRGKEREEGRKEGRNVLCRLMMLIGDRDDSDGDYQLRYVKLLTVKMKTKMKIFVSNFLFKKYSSLD
jgi:hypothetical protein